MEHRYAKHCKPDGPCDREFCSICVGGLAVCEVCNLYEGSLTTECPGVPSYGEHADAVYAGKEDFRGGKWVEGYTVHMAHIYGPKFSDSDSTERKAVEAAHRGDVAEAERLLRNDELGQVLSQALPPVSPGP